MHVAPPPPYHQGGGQAAGGPVSPFHDQDIASIAPLEYGLHRFVVLGQTDRLSFVMLGKGTFSACGQVGKSCDEGERGRLAQLHFMPHFKTVPEPMSSKESDNLLRTRDALNPDQLNFVSYNTRDDGRRQQNHDNPLICARPCPCSLVCYSDLPSAFAASLCSRGIAPLAAPTQERGGRSRQRDCACCCLPHPCASGFLCLAGSSFVQRASPFACLPFLSPHCEIVPCLPACYKRA